MQSFTITKTPTVEASAYAAGDVIGGLMALSDAGALVGDGGVVDSGILYSAVDVPQAVSVILFDSNPSASTFTENSAPTIHADDRSKIIGVLGLSGLADLGTPVIRYADNPHVPFRLPVGKDLYAVAIAGGAITPGTTADLTFVFGIRRDRPQ